MPADHVIPAAGGVVWHEGEDGVEVAVVHRPKYDDWSLPKGKLDPGEGPLSAAVREVREETGLEVTVGRRGVSTSYPVAGGTKRVDYWLMHAVGGVFLPNDEVDELRWLPLREARALVSYDHDRAVLDDAGRTDVPREPRVLLVRHASAGDRRDWDGPDELRPLDARGRAQARRLAEVLPEFLPLDLLSATPLRCRQTVEPLADRMGLDIRPAPEFGEQEVAADPRPALAALEGLLSRAGPGVTVVCSQGGAIPSLLLALGVRGHGVPGLHPPSAKSSVWALGGRPGALFADYYRDL